MDESYRSKLDDVLSNHTYKIQIFTFGRLVVGVDQSACLFPEYAGASPH